MKRFRSSLLFLGLAALAAAQTPAGGRFESMKVHATEMPRFPAVLVARGVTNGLVQVVAKVDETGRLEDWLVVGYSQPLLADLAVEALKEWQFTPARFDGQPTTAQSQIEFNFRVDGVVISQHMTEHFLARVSGRSGPELVYRPCSLRDLDRIPTPVNVISPYYDDKMVSEGLRGEVTVDFYIDEKGQVRMPVVSADQPPQLAALALDAVRQWTFEPPTRRGEPVLVQARQRFNFVPREVRETMATN